MSSTLSRRRSAFIIAFSLAVLSAAGCLFEPRVAESPAANTQSSWIVPDAPTKVFDNMTSGLTSLSGTNYEKSLSVNPSFTFIPLPSDNSQFPGTFDNWNRNDEIGVLQTIVGDASSITIKFANRTQYSQELSKATYDSDYDLEIISKTTADTTVYKAKGRFYFEDSSKGWVLVKWEDIVADPAFPSWGFLRGSLSSP